ncbi:SDR family oxidoreductase [Vibrio campbellii]|uniref:SDR family oxidoreductase n=1 Tax=Vibrio campbellii TaxID=680 RepID=A0ACC7RGZ7_9VIBR|nr:SDR family oxidoreductase [Vibrio campbellii]MCC4226132.1 SDR family oxidoreductase [Vibrio campbellii]
MLTIVGAHGFVGSSLIRKIKSQGLEYQILTRELDINPSDNLGTVLYCAGYGDCSEPQQVIEANLIHLENIFKFKLDRLVYLSSTRLYLNSKNTRENCDLTICSDDSRKLFNLSKMAAEEICFLNKNVETVILRPSNIYGLATKSKLFLPSITRDAVTKGVINMFVSKEYEKDYVNVSDVVDAMLFYAKRETEMKFHVVNVASGKNTSAQYIADKIHGETGCKVNWNENISKDVFYPINIDKISREMSFHPKDIKEDIICLVNKFKKQHEKC